jgi:hypothetical protein
MPKIAVSLGVWFALWTATPDTLLAAMPPAPVLPVPSAKIAAPVAVLIVWTAGVSSLDINVWVMVSLLAQSLLQRA